MVHSDCSTGPYIDVVPPIWGAVISQLAHSSASPKILAVYQRRALNLASWGLKTLGRPKVSWAVMPGFQGPRQAHKHVLGAASLPTSSRFT